MDTALQGMMLISALAVAFERIIELVRWFMDQPFARPVRGVLDALTAGRGAVLPAVAFACLTNANLQHVFQLEKGELKFFSAYLQGYPDGGRAIAGCVLMGLALTLGSRFWHDVVKGLTDVRNRIKSVPLEEAPLRTPPVKLPSTPLVAPA